MKMMEKKKSNTSGEEKCKNRRNITINLMSILTLYS